MMTILTSVGLAQKRSANRHLFGVGLEAGAVFGTLTGGSRIQLDSQLLIAGLRLDEYNAKLQGGASISLTYEYNQKLIIDIGIGNQAFKITQDYDALLLGRTRIDTASGIIFVNIIDTINAQAFSEIFFYNYFARVHYPVFASKKFQLSAALGASYKPIKWLDWDFEFLEDRGEFSTLSYFYIPESRTAFQRSLHADIGLVAQYRIPFHHHVFMPKLSLRYTHSLQPIWGFFENAEPWRLSMLTADLGLFVYFGKLDFREAFRRGRPR